MKYRLIIFINFSLFISLGSAIASDHGCKVLLCMANPAGAMAEKECRPTIRKLYRDLFKRKPFPKCEFPTPSAEQKMLVTTGYEKFFPCNVGYTQVAISGKKPSAECRKFLRNEKTARGKTRAVYDTYRARSRPEPHWIKITTNTGNGPLQGQQFWYKKESKKILF